MKGPVPLPSAARGHLTLTQGGCCGDAESSLSQLPILHLLFLLFIGTRRTWRHLATLSARSGEKRRCWWQRFHGSCAQDPGCATPQVQREKTSPSAESFVLPEVYFSHNISWLDGRPHPSHQCYLQKVKINCIS